MKNFNFLYGALVVILVAVFAFSCVKDRESQDIPTSSNSPIFGQTCLEKTGCSSYNPEIINNVTLPAYPGCVFRVRVFTCVQSIAGIGTEIFVGNYEILDATDCPELWEAWSSLVLDPESQPGEINDFVNTLDQQVYARLEDYLFAKYGNIVGCNSPLGTLVISFIKSTCNTMCSHQYDTNPYPHDDGDDTFGQVLTETRVGSKYGILVRANCDTNGCCQRRTTICYNPVIDKVEKTTTLHPTFVSTCLGGVVDTPPSGVLVNCLPCSFSCN